MSSIEVPAAITRLGEVRPGAQGYQTPVSAVAHIGNQQLPVITPKKVR